MARTSLTVLVIASLASFTGRAWAEGYLCIAEHAAGFRFDKATKRWSSTTFSTDEKYIVRKPNPEERKIYAKALWVVARFGHSGPVSICERDSGQSSGLICEGFESFKLSRKNLRFLTAYTIGYWSDNMQDPNDVFAEGKNTPSMNMGTCSEI